MRKTIALFMGSLSLAVMLLSLKGQAMLALVGPKAEVDPATFIPANSFVVLHSDGTEAHMPDITATAAWKSLRDSGLQDRILDLVTMLMGELDESGRARELVVPSLKHLMSHGATLAASLSASGEGVAPVGVMLVPEGESGALLIDRLLAFFEEQADQELHHKAISGRDVAYILSPGQPGLEIAWWRESGYLVAVIGMDAASQIIATVEGQHASVARDARWQSLRTSDRFTVDYFGWLEAQSLLTQFGQTPLPDSPRGVTVTVSELAGWLGVANLRSKSGSDWPVTPF